MDENARFLMNNAGANPAAGKESAKALDDLVSRALAYRTGKELRELFEFTRRFPHIAPFNAMLLHVQNRGIRYALRAPKWEREYRRRVRPAARPYLAGYLNDGQALPNYSLDAVLKAGGEIEKMVAGNFRPKRKPTQTAGTSR